MNHLETIATAPVLDLTPQDIDDLLNELSSYHAIFSPLFKRFEQREWSQPYLHGLLLELPRKSIEPMILGAEHALSKHQATLTSVPAWQYRTSPFGRAVYGG